MAMVQLTTPLSESAIATLAVGDIVTVSGTIFTGRDAFHKYIFDGNAPPCTLRGQILYHCGPIVVAMGDRWEVMAAGPTTSSRQEPYAWKVIESLGIRAIIGKGGMGRATVDACAAHGCVYLHAIGGAAQWYAEKIARVNGVHFLDEFGGPEAMWEFTVKDFPAVVTIDAHGASLHEDIRHRSDARLKGLLA